MDIFSTTLIDGSPVFISKTISKPGWIDVCALLRSGSSWIGSVRMDVLSDVPSLVVCANCITNKETAL